MTNEIHYPKTLKIGLFKAKLGERGYLDMGIAFHDEYWTAKVGRTPAQELARKLKEALRLGDEAYVMVGRNWE